MTRMKTIALIDTRLEVPGVSLGILVSTHPDVMAEPKLRARIRRGLLKVEQLHALARDIYYGRRGRINAP